MEISIVIPTFNRSFIISRTLDSIFNQTHKEFEVVIIDDGSTDNTETIIKPYLKRNIKYIKINHRGTPFAWNLGVKESKNSYVLLVGDDVILDKNCLSNLISVINYCQKRKIGAIAPRLVYVSNFNRLKEYADKRYAFIDPITGDIVGSFNVKSEKIFRVPILHGYSLVRKEAFLDIGGFDTKTFKGNYYREETDLWLRMKNRGYNLYYQPKAIIYCLKSLKKGGQWLNVRENLLVYEYYVIRNHREYLKKHFGKKRFLMLPAFIVRRLYVRLHFLGLKNTS